MTARRWLLLCAIVGFVACAIGVALDAHAMLGCWLAAWFAVASIPIGALGVLFTSYLVRGGWTQDLHAPLMRAALMLPVAGLLFIPALIGMKALYPWAAADAALPWFKTAYLAPWFFVLRTILYFAIWTALALWAQRAFEDPDARVRAAAVGLIVWSLTVSFAGIDWLESIEPDFHSSIYGLLAISFTLLSGLAFGMLVVLQRAPRQMANTAYAGVLLSVLLLWAYLHAMQYIIIWTGNIPDEVVWYAERSAGGWAVALWVLFGAQFIIPFFALLSERVRASTLALIWIAGVTLALRFLEAAVLVLPPLKVGWALALCLPAAMLATGATLLLAWRTSERWRERLPFALSASR
ncbi:MAG: hypothetical protein JO000_10150 [Alphaproteobacteria bacterium]|nr:hypothetical protein [Alphaproteobacteria bacterium]